MNGLLVFNSGNDIVFQQLNSQLDMKIRDIAVEQGLLAQDSTAVLDENILLQIFSPVISSQRIMHAQFDNTYSSFQCENGLNFAFSDLLGFTFVKIGQRPVEQLKRHLGVAIALARCFYGVNLFTTQASTVQRELLYACLRCYEQYLWDEEETMLLEALPRLMINTELKSSVRNTLESALECLREQGHTRVHTVLFVAHKFVDMVKSKQALKLSPSDLLFLALLNRSLEYGGKRYFHTSVAVFLQGTLQDPKSGCVPCIAHLSQLDAASGIVLVQIIEYANLQVACSMYDTFFVVQKIVSVQSQGDNEALRPAFDSLEHFVKQSVDAIKRAKVRGEELEVSLKKVCSRWDNLRKMFTEYFKTLERELLVRIEANIPSFNEELKLLFTMICCDSSTVALDQLPEVTSLVEGKLLEITEFLVVTAERNITIDAYLEDFPGLVHFIYVDRSVGVMITPELRCNQLVPKKLLWSMIEYARNYLKKGQSTVMWKDKTFNYSYFFWLEDQSNGAVKFVDLQEHFVAPASTSSCFKSMYEPGLLACDYYQQLVEICFPKVAPSKIKCYELFCIHLGLVTATCATEHSRRLVATITDAIGQDCF